MWPSAWASEGAALALTAILNDAAAPLLLGLRLAQVVDELHATLDRARREGQRWQAKQLPLGGAPTSCDDPRARRIEVAAAVCQAAMRALPPHEDFTKNARWIRSVQNLRDAIITDKNDAESFSDYIDYMALQPNDPQQMVKCMTRWPRLRKYWPRLRRRICTYCGACVDLSKPRFLVCGGCAEGPRVGRYCSDNCQREDWPEHQKACPLIHHMPAVEQPWLRKMQNTVLIEGIAQAKSAGLSPEEYFSKYSKFRSELFEEFGSSYDEFVRTL